MSTRADTLEPLAPLWQPPVAAPPRWVIWHAGEETMVFDTELNGPALVEDHDLGEVLRRMREAGVPESDEYPGRPCG
ncbi:hypothetical protein [Streptomyces sp. NPDC047928]|uniref:hypothetical protein n=1 Tax=unclassified Streptomyces TaxID=2593676 RepID=UPI003714FDC6